MSEFDDEGHALAEGQTWRVAPDDVGARLDAWVAAQGGGPPRSQVKRAIAEGRLTVDGESPSKAGQKLQLGQAVAFVAPEPVPTEAAPEPVDFGVAHEDPSFAVVDKPAGLVVHPAHGHPSGTLVNGLLHRFGALPESAGGGASQRPGIVHRLDMDTSGLLVVARSPEAHRSLSAQFAERTVHRRYLAVVVGTKLDHEGTLATFYGRHPTQRKRMTSRLRDGRRAVTHWRVLARGEALSLLMCRLETGRTHQIRVHLSERGHPIVGDTLYGHTLAKGGGGRLAQELAAARRMPRHALHAASLGFEHPVTSEHVRWQAPPPGDLTHLIDTVFGVDATARAMDVIRAEP